MAVKIEKFTSEDRGRGYRTVTRVKVGELVLKAQPFVHVLCNTERGNRCDFCLRSTESLLRCSSCKFSRYCNVKCQRSAWTCHKAECKSLKKVSPRIPTDSVRLMSRILYKLKDKSCESQTITEFMSLQSHDTALSPEKKEQFSQLLFVLNQYVDEGTLPNDVSDLLCIFGRMTSNSFSVCDSEMKPIGVGIYPSASLLNHSCDPNCVAVFNGTDLCIRAVKPISVGDECVISYIEMMSTTSERREHLQDQYYFHCVCHACKDIDKDNLKQSIQCHTGGCNEPIVMKNNGFAACSKCGHQYDKTHHQIVSQSVNVVKQALLKIEDAKKQQNCELVLQLCEQHLENSVLHSYNIYMVQLFDKAMDVCIELQQWESALNYGLKTTEPYRLHYPSYHPNTGVQFARIAKLQMYLSYLQEAHRYLQEALNILEVTHGKGHPLTTDLQRLLHECQEERRVQRTKQLDADDPLRGAQIVNVHQKDI